MSTVAIAGKPPASMHNHLLPIVRAMALVAAHAFLHSCAEPAPAPTLIAIQPGSFAMGTPGTVFVGELQHTVMLTRAFWIGKYEVTQAEYTTVTGSNPSSHVGDSLPVETVSWDDAMQYCAKLSAQEASLGRLPAGYQYRLPTEAEWEYCCRAGTTTPWSTGTSIRIDQANLRQFGTPLGTTTIVGNYAPNPWGLHDMHGNVEEMCIDAGQGDVGYVYTTTPTTTDPFHSGYGISDLERYRMARGGSFLWSSSSAQRGSIYPTVARKETGFRVVLAPILVLHNASLIPIDTGWFNMGSNTGLDGERPIHRVHITRPFWIGKHEVTQAEYTAVTGSNPSSHVGDSLPVETVSWDDAMQYCVKLSAQEASLGRLPAGFQYRLPTEAEWEYCCRAGTNTEFSVGDSLSCTDANFNPLYALDCPPVTATVAVGGYPANRFGLHDMHGNVMEWCLDASASYQAGPAFDPYTPSGASRINRGGAYFNIFSYYCRSATRLVGNPSDRASGLGFRVVLAHPIGP